MLKSMMLQLGVYQFNINLSAYNNLQRIIKYNWVKNKRIKEGAALSFQGIESENLKLTGVIYPFFKGGLAQLELMKAQADLGAPLILVSAGGLVFGKWIIISIRETQTIFHTYGAPRKIAFSLELERFIK